MERLEIVQKYLFAKHKIIALDDRVIIEHKKLTTEYQSEYRYSELKSKVTRGKSSDSGWTELGFIFLIGIMVLSIVVSITYPKAFNNPSNSILPLGLVVLMLFAFSLRLVKYDCVWFDNKDDDFVFVVRLTKRDREQGEKVIKFIIDKIKHEEAEARPK